MGVFFEISIILVISLVVASILKLLKQPLLIAYIITGILVGPYFLNFINHSGHQIETFSKMGITILLFIVGLSLSPKVIREVGKVAVATGVGQIVFTSAIGFLIAKFLGYPTLPSIYIAIALTFSSTIIILKLLSDKNDLEKLYGKISVGFLLVQDIAATVILLFVTSLSVSSNQGDILFIFLRGILIIIGLSLVSYLILEKIVTFFAKSQELLFLFSISFGIGMASLFYKTGLSVEIGALFAGVLLSNTPYAVEIGAKLKPLRDFFITLFFVLLGAQLQVGELNQILLPTIIFSVFVLIGNPLIVFFIMTKLGFSNKTSFMSGLSVAQISEFSLILVTLAYGVNHIDATTLSLVTLVGILTITGSTYMIIYSNPLYKLLEGTLAKIAFKGKYNKTKENDIKDYNAILFGFDRIGKYLYEALRKTDFKFLVVDFDPQKIKLLNSKNITSSYGDLDDIEFLDTLNLHKTKLVISTTNDIDANILLIKRVKHTNPKCVLVITSENLKTSIELYKQGADYVIMPHFVSAKVGANIIKKNLISKNNYKTTKLKDLKKIKRYYSEDINGIKLN